MGKILYLGGFQLPDKNAAAQRVILVSKILSKLDKEVILCGIKINGSSISSGKIEETNFFFYEIPIKKNLKEKIKNSFSLKNEMNVIMHYSELEAIICYNYPIIKMLRLKRYCYGKNIKLIGDITEWYAESELRFPLNLIKDLDTFLRMRYFNKKLDGLICISKFLEKYYNKKKCIYLPGMVDIEQSKWNKENTNKLMTEKIIITFIGNSGLLFEKERLDIVLYAIQRYNSMSKRKIIFKIIGMDLEVFKINNIKIEEIENLKILGKIPHLEAIKELKKSDFSIIPRENKRNIIAGFPTKLGESLCCGIPVISTKYGEVKNYIKNNFNGYILNDCRIETFIDTFNNISKLTEKELEEMKLNAYESRKNLDFRNFIDKVGEIF